VDVLEGESLGPREQGGYIVAGVVLARLRAVRVSKGNHGPTARRSGGAKPAALIGQGARLQSTKTCLVTQQHGLSGLTQLYWTAALCYYVKQQRHCQVALLFVGQQPVPCLRRVESMGDLPRIAPIMTLRRTRPAELTRTQHRIRVTPGPKMMPGAKTAVSRFRLDWTCTLTVLQHVARYARNRATGKAESMRLRQLRCGSTECLIVSDAARRSQEPR
jgi:hypothetical protein